MLSFSERNENNELVRTWAPKRTGNYATDCATGRAHAIEVMRVMREQGNPALLGHVVRCFENKGCGVEVGFIYQLSLDLLATSRS